MNSNTRTGMLRFGPIAPLLLAGAAAWGCNGSVPSNPGAGAGAAPSGTAGNGTGGDNVGTGAGGASAAGASGVDPTCAALDAVPRRLWRLSSQQYSNAVRDLLGLPQGPALATNGGTATYAFFSDDTQQVSYDYALDLYTALQPSLAQLNPTALAACRAGEAQAACAQRFAQEFGARAFRRPLDPAEVTALLLPYAEGAKTSFNAGISSMVEALLMSPSFVYRTELGTTVAPDAAGNVPDTSLTPYEVATQLAFMLTDTTPDAELTAAAASGALGTDAGIAAQVDRLLQLPPVRQNIDNIVLNWFNVNQLFAISKDPSYFAANQDQTLIQNDLLTSARNFVNDVLWSGMGKVDGLVTSTKIFVNQRLATLYGLPFSGAADQFVGVDATDGRAGLLTQPAWLWGASHGSDTSIVHRGISIHNDVLCVDKPPDPPPGLLTSAAVVADLAALPTERMKSNYRLEPAHICSACHTQIDPFALVLEEFDPIGRHRTLADGVPANPTADFSRLPPLSGTITGAVAFSQALVPSKLFSGCAVQKLTSYAIGRLIRTRATCEVQALRDQFDQSDGTMSSVLREVALASFMRARAGGAL